MSRTDEAADNTDRSYHYVEDLLEGMDVPPEQRKRIERRVTEMLATDAALKAQRATMGHRSVRPSTTAKRGYETYVELQTPVPIKSWSGNGETIAFKDDGVGFMHAGFDDRPVGAADPTIRELTSWLASKDYPYRIYEDLFYTIPLSVTWRINSNDAGKFYYSEDGILLCERWPRRSDDSHFSGFENRWETACSQWASIAEDFSEWMIPDA